MFNLFSASNSFPEYRIILFGESFLFIKFVSKRDSFRYTNLIYPYESFEDFKLVSLLDSFTIKVSLNHLQFRSLYDVLHSVIFGLIYHH